MSKLSAAALAKMQPGEVLWDDQVTGLHAKRGVQRTSFYLYFRTKDRQERRPKIGDAGVLTLPQARDVARLWLLQNARGEAVKPGLTDVERLTVADLHAEWQKQHKPRLKAGTQIAMEGYWRRSILPALGKMRVCQVDRKSVAAMLEKVAVEKPTTANRVQAVLSVAMQLAEKWEWRPQHTNPCRLISRQKEKARKRYLSVEELQRFGSVIREWENGDRWRRSSGQFFRLLLLTGARKNEIATAKREWVDFERGLLCLPDSKTGEKDIPLSVEAMDLIRKMIAECPDSVWLCPGRDPSKPIHNHYNSWLSLTQQAGLKDFRIHDLRHTFASVAISYGVDMKRIGEILGHRDPSATQRYTHLMWHKQKEIVNAVAENIAGAMQLPAGVRVGTDALADTRELRVVG